MTAPTPNAMPGAAAPVQPAAPAPEAPQQPPPEAPATAPLPTQSDSRPPWEKAGVEFDPEKAWQLIQNVKGELNEYKTRTDPIVAEREQLRRASMEDTCPVSPASAPRSTCRTTTANCSPSPRRHPPPVCPGGLGGGQQTTDTLVEWQKYDLRDPVIRAASGGC
jgi:hypothetical protein